LLKGVSTALVLADYIFDRPPVDGRSHGLKLVH
jgi:hypothetical protein